jgi:chromosomal replication initiator protein
MEKTVVDIADLMPDKLIQEVRNNIELYIRGIEAGSDKIVTYKIEFGTIILESKIKQIKTKADIIKSVILGYFNCFKNEIYRKGNGSNRRRLVYPRQVTAYFIDRKTKLSLAEVGRVIGGYNHATVIHSKRHIKDLYEVDKEVRNDIDELEQKITKRLKGL